MPRCRRLAAFTRDSDHPRSNIAEHDLVDGHLVQRSEIARVGQIAFNLGEASRGQFGLFDGENSVTWERMVSCILVAAIKPLGLRVRS